MYGKLVTVATIRGFNKVRSSVYRNFLPKKYEFKSRIPKDPLRYEYTPHHLWKGGNPSQYHR